MPDTVISWFPRAPLALNAGIKVFSLWPEALCVRKNSSNIEWPFEQASERHYSQAQDAGKYNKCAFIILIGQSFSGLQIESSYIPTVFGSVIGVRGVIFRQTVANIHDTSRPPRMQSLLKTLIFEGSKWMRIPTRTTLRDLFENIDIKLPRENSGDFIYQTFSFLLKSQTRNTSW